MDKNQLESPEYSTRIRVAKYLRMSTDPQQHSIENQSEFIDKYASQHNMVVVKEYVDSGKSGLHLKGRLGLQQLLSDVENRICDFKAILVYDISRWGRFQNLNEGAAYQFICESAGIKVIYCAEEGSSFENYGTLPAFIMESLKRSAAADYSKGLSQRVFIGQCHLISLGYRQGGFAGFGLRRMLVDANNIPKGLLNHGERKSIQTDRVLLVPGPDNEINCVNRIYRWFIDDKKTEKEIAELLNNKGIRTDLDRNWSKGTVHQVLTNEKYIGHNVYNRQSFKLKIQRIKNPHEEWVRKDHSFDAIVPVDLFNQARKIIMARSEKISNEQMLAMLEHLWKTKGALSGLLIDEQDGMPSSSIYRSKFGGLLKAYTLIGFTPERDYQYIETNKQLRIFHSEVINQVVTGLSAKGACVQSNKNNDLMIINNEWKLSLIIAKCIPLSQGKSRWLLRFESSLNPDITVAVRMSHNNVDVLDYYIIPHIHIDHSLLKVRDKNKFGIDAYRFDTLDFLYKLAARTILEEAI